MTSTNTTTIDLDAALGAFNVAPTVAADKAAEIAAIDDQLAKIDKLTELVEANRVDLLKKKAEINGTKIKDGRIYSFFGTKFLAIVVSLLSVAGVAIVVSLVVLVLSIIFDTNDHDDPTMTIVFACIKALLWIVGVLWGIVVFRWAYAKVMTPKKKD